MTFRCVLSKLLFSLGKTEKFSVLNFTMQAYVEIRLFASLKPKTPQNAERFPITSGTTVGDIVESVGIPREEAKLIFIDGIRGYLYSVLTGGERVAIFPPVGGG